MTFKILMTCAGGEMSPQLYSNLRNSKSHPIEIIAVDMDSAAIGKHFSNHFCVVPPADSSEYVGSIEAICNKFDVDMILPGSDEEVFALTPFRDRIEKQGLRYLACASNEVLRKIQSKISTYKSLAELDIPTPEWREVNSLNELLPVLQDMQKMLGDVVVKPSGGRGGRDVYVIRNDVPYGQVQDRCRQKHLNYDTFVENVSKFSINNFPLVVSERLLDPVYDIDLLAWNGRKVSVVPRCRIDSFDPNKGHKIINRPELIALGEQLIAKLGLSALLDCDVMYGKNGQPYVIEINPRPSGSVAFTMAAGVPLIENLVSLCLGEGEEVFDEYPLVEREARSYKSILIEQL